jgi:sRNA-binding carbon storage regulator CsrA
MCIECGFDRRGQWFRLYPRETLDLRRITLERLLANGPIVFSVTWTRRGGVRLGVEAPLEIAIKRGELLQRQAS